MEDGWEDCDKPFNVDGKTILVARAKQGIDDKLEANLSVWSNVAPTEEGWYWVFFGGLVEVAELVVFGDDGESWYYGDRHTRPVGWKFGPKLTPPPGPKEQG